jgi:hypothetical protein
VDHLRRVYVIWLCLRSFLCGEWLGLLFLGGKIFQMLFKIFFRQSNRECAITGDSNQSFVAIETRLSCELALIRHCNKKKFQKKIRKKF